VERKYQQQDAIKRIETVGCKEGKESEKDRFTHTYS
jgi:hypothetical protein